MFIEEIILSSKSSEFLHIKIIINIVLKIWFKIINISTVYVALKNVKFFVCIIRKALHIKAKIETYILIIIVTIITFVMSTKKKNIFSVRTPDLSIWNISTKYSFCTRFNNSRLSGGCS